MRPKLRLLLRGFIVALMVLISQVVLADNWLCKHGLSSAEYDAECNNQSNRGFMIVDVCGYTDSGVERYAAIWERGFGPPRAARHGQSEAEYIRDVNAFKAKGYRPIHLSAYSVRGEPRFATIYLKDSSTPYVVRHKLTSKGYQQEVDYWVVQKGYLIREVNGYTLNGTPRFTAIFEKRNGVKQIARHDLFSSAYNDEVKKWHGNGYRLTHVTGYTVGSSVRYAALWEKRSTKGLVARHGLIAANYQSEIENMYYRGYQLRKVNVCQAAGKPLFAAIWSGGGLSDVDEHYIETTVNAFMDKYHVPGLAMAITKDGRLVYAQGFRKADEKNDVRVRPTHLFRVASVSKPITSIAIMELIHRKQLNLSDKVFGEGAWLGTMYGKKPYSQWVKGITVQHLLEHTSGGWCKVSDNSSTDPMFAKPNYNHAQLIGWVLDNFKLKNAPGTEYEYSNFGYCLLGRVIEQCTGMNYEAFVRGILNKAGITDMWIGGDEENQRRWNEVVYYGQEDENPYEMKLRRMDAHGGWIASPIDLCKLLVRVDNFPTKQDILPASMITTMTTPSAVKQTYAKGWFVNTSNNWWHGGTFAGSQSIMVRANRGYNWAVVINTRIKSKKDSLREDIDRLPWDIVNGVKRWPLYDLFESQIVKIIQAPLVPIQRPSRSGSSS